MEIASADPRLQNAKRPSQGRAFGSCPVWTDVGYQFPKCCQHFAVLGLAPRFGLGVDELAIDMDIEDALLAGDQRQIIDHVLIGGQDLFSHAHGVR